MSTPSVRMGFFCAIPAAEEQHLHHGQTVPGTTPPQLTERRSRACQRSCGAVHRRHAGGAPAASGEHHEEAAQDNDQQAGALHSTRHQEGHVFSSSRTTSRPRSSRLPRHRGGHRSRPGPHRHRQELHPDRQQPASLTHEAQGGPSRHYNGMVG